MVELLLQYGCFPKINSETLIIMEMHHDDALHYGYQFSVDMFVLLSKYQVDVFSHINEFYIDAIVIGDLDFIKFCLENGVDINYDNGAAQSKSIRYEMINIAEYLAQNGADINFFDIDQIIRCECGDEQVCKFIKYLVDSGINLNPNQHMINAVAMGSMYLTGYFIELGADIHIEDDLALFTAAHYGHTNMVTFLLEMGISTDNDKILPFISDSKSKEYEEIIARIKILANDVGPIPILVLVHVEMDLSKIFKILITNGFPKLDPLLFICILKDYRFVVDEEILEYFIENGFDIHTEYDGQTILEISVLYHRKELIKLLLDYGIRGKDSALKTAFKYSDSEMIRSLLDHGAEFDPETECNVFHDVIDLLETYGIVNHKLQLPQDNMIHY